jgi:ABC-type microcin C transport system permease subunit YejB
MLKYIAKRLAYAVLVLLGVSLIMYFLVRLMPVDFIQSKIDQMNQGGAVVELDTQIAMYDTYGLEYPDKLIEQKIDDLKKNGKPASEISQLLKGNTCGPRATSCADQLSIALEKAINE